MLNKLNNFSSPHLLLFPQMHTNTLTNKHIHAEKSKQRYTCSKKKKKKKHKDTQTHPHTNKPIRTNNKETDRCFSKRSMLDLYLTGTIRACGSCLIGARGYGSCLIGARGYGSCLIEAMEIGACESMPDQVLWIEAREIGACLIRAVVQCL